MVWIADALSKGIDGIMLIGCKYGDDYQCHFMKGSELAEYRMSKISETLQRLVLEPERINVQQLAIDEFHKLPKLIDEFMEVLAQLRSQPVQRFLRRLHSWRRTVIAEPDLQFTKDLIAAGAGDLKKCYQCATCSVACRIAPDNEPYPRKEMIWAQWGLKDRLSTIPTSGFVTSVTTAPPSARGARIPADVLKAVRKMNIQENSWPSFLGKLVGEPRCLCWPWLSRW